MTSREPRWSTRALALLLAHLVGLAPAVVRADFPPPTRAQLQAKDQPPPLPPLTPTGPPPGPAEPVAVLSVRPAAGAAVPPLDMAGLYGAMQGAGLRPIVDGRARALLAGEPDPWAPAGRGSRLLDGARTALGALDHARALMLAEQALGLLGLADSPDEARQGLIAGHALALVAAEGLPDSPTRRRSTVWHSESLRRLWALSPASKDPAAVPPGVPPALWARLPVTPPAPVARKVAVTTDPPGALVSANTAAAAPAPATLSLPPGRHLITARADGRVATLRWLDVSERDVEVALALAATGPDPLAEAAAAARGDGVRGPDSRTLLGRVGRLAGAERLVVLQVSPQGDSRSAFSFDVRSGQRSSVRDLGLRAPSGALAAFVVEVARAAVAPVGSVGAVAAAGPGGPVAIRKVDKPLPFYRKWWFWGAIGLAAAIVLIATREGSDPTPSTVTLRVERK